MGSAARVSVETYQERIRRVEPRFGDLVYSREGTYFGIAAEVPKGIQVCLGQRMVLIRPDSARISHAFLKYWLNSPLVFGHIHGFRDGTVAERLNLPVIRGLAIAFPTLEEQLSIAKVLSALDDRITLLCETNATLEAIAQALFKSWFVDFDPVHAKQQGHAPEGMDEATAALFPDGFEESELGVVPRGWRIGSILEVANLLSGGTPKTDRTEFWNGDIPWASAKDVSQSSGSILVSTERTITRAGLEHSSTRLIPRFATVIVARGATTGRMVLFGQEMAMNQTCYGLTSKQGSHLALYCQLRREIGALVSAAHGSVFDTITTKTFAHSLVVQPPERVLARFEAIANPIFDRINVNCLQAQTLSTLRDTLLPRLISGQLRLPDAESIALQAA